MADPKDEKENKEDQGKKKGLGAFAGLVGDEDDINTVGDELNKGENTPELKEQKPAKASKSSTPEKPSKEENEEDEKENGTGDKKEKGEKDKKPPKKSTPKKTEKVKEVEVVSAEAKLLFDHGINMKGGISSEIDFDTFKKIVGTPWKDEVSGDNSTIQRISNKNMEYVKLIADTTKVSYTQALNNLLAFSKYMYADYLKKLQKEREQIEL